MEGPKDQCVGYGRGHQALRKGTTLQRSYQRKEAPVLWSSGSRRRADETSDGRRDRGKTKEMKTYDYLDDEFEGVEWRECNRTHEAGAQQGGVEKKCQKMGAPTAASAKDQMMMGSCDCINV